MKKLLYLLVTVALFISACGQMPTPEPTIPPTSTPEPTEVPPTEVPTAVPTVVPPTPLPTVEPTLPPVSDEVEEPFINKLNCPAMQCDIVNGAPEGWKLDNFHPEQGEVEVAHAYNGGIYQWHVLQGWRTIGFFWNGREESDDPDNKGMSFVLRQKFRCSDEGRCLQKGALYRFTAYFFGFAGDIGPPGIPSHPDAEIYMRMCVNTEGEKDINHPATLCTEPYSNMLRGLYDTTIYDGLTPINDVFRADDLYDRVSLHFVGTGEDIVVFLAFDSPWAWSLQSVTIDALRVEAVGMADDFFTMGQ